jgi:hypothetical protein
MLGNQMARRIFAAGMVAVLTLGLAGLRPGAATAAGGVTFTLNIRSAFLREQPDQASARSYSIFQGQSFAVTGRIAAGDWLLLDFAGAAGGNTWIPLSYGVVSGNLETVPVVIPSFVPPTATPVRASSTTGGSVASISGPVRFTITVSSVFGRSGPDLHSARIISFFKGQVYTATGRSADGAWVRLALAGGGSAWVSVFAGQAQGSIASLPIAGANSPAPTAAPPASLPGWTMPTVSAVARQIYQRGLALGNDPNAFSKIGDCNSVAPFFLAPFDKGEYALGSSYAYLQGAIDNFAGSFDRDGAAAHDGLNTASIFDSTWADPTLCEPSETPVSCEMRIQRPSIAFISLGTNGGWQTNAEYEGNLRRLLDYLIGRGVLPILSTKADNLEGGDRFNQIVAQLAAEYQLPLWDFASAAHVLPGSGLADTYHLGWGRAYYDTGAAPQRGWQVRNLTALLSLEAVWRGAR